jgi:tetratricopeptide (TPR) repeat protein
MRALSLLLLTAVLTACATAPQGTAPRSTAPEIRIPADGVDEQAELVYQILRGELAGQLGDLPQSVTAYLDAAQRSDDPRVAERAARIAVFADDREAALAAAQRWIELAPDNLEAHQYLAVLYVRANDPEAAQPHLDAIIAATGEMHGGGFLLISSMLSRDVDAESALAALALLVERYPDDAQAHFAYASLAMRAQAHKLAAAAAEDALRLDSGLLDARVLRARAWMALGQTEQALADLRAAVAEHPGKLELRLAYARTLVQAREYAGALTEFARVYEARPDDSELLYTMGLLSIELKRYEQASGQFERLLETGHRTDEASYYLGRIAEQRQQYKRAIGWYVRVVGGELQVDAQARIAGSLAKLGRIEEATEHLELLRSQTTDQAALIQLYIAEGQLLGDASRYESAMDLYNRALLLYPANADLLYARALMAERIDRLDLLEADLRTILATDPRNASALNALGYTLADRTDRYQEALDYITRALAERPNDPAIIDSLGWVHYRLGNFEEAEKQLRRAYSMLKDPEIAAHLAELLLVRGQTAEAKGLFRQALEEHPGHETLLELQRRFGL